MASVTGTDRRVEHEPDSKMLADTLTYLPIVDSPCRRSSTSHCYRIRGAQSTPTHFLFSALCGCLFFWRRSLLYRREEEGKSAKSILGIQFSSNFCVHCGTGRE